MKIKTKINAGVFILLLQVIVVFLSEFISRSLTYFNHTVQILFSLFFISLLFYYFYKNHIRKTLVPFVLLALTILAIGIFRNQFFLNIFQLLLVISNFIFIFYAHKLNDRNIRKLIVYILIFSFLQLFFDLLFPKDAIDPRDRYSGTFIMANNKSRFLMFVLPLVLYLPKKFFTLKWFGKLLLVVSILYSAYIGYSKLSVLLFVGSVVLALFFKNIYFIAIIYIASMFIVPTQTKKYIDSHKGKRMSHLEMDYHRFFHKGHGVAAIYIYGFDQLKESNFLGVGYGNFSSRAGQLFKSEVTANIPKQLIKYWYPLFDTKAPYGLSSLFVLIVELGIFSIVPIVILLVWMQALIREGHYFLRLMVIYLFFIINYNPTFFEFNESLLYFITILVAYYYVAERKEKLVSFENNITLFDNSSTNTPK